MESVVSGENIKKETNMRREKVSVCMACYNGATYIEEQINSILPKLSEADELLIIDDGSSDNTEEVIRTIDDARIKYVKNEKNLGVNRSFEKAIKLSKNHFIFMADQDDLWTDGRLECMLDELCKGKMLVSGNSEAIDATGGKSDYDLGFLYTEDSNAYQKNIVRIFTGKAYYYGCAMAFRRELNKLILPFPEYIESHDLWIAMAANMAKSNSHIEEIVLKRRIHGKNASVLQRKLTEKLYSRWIFAKSYAALRWRLLKSGI